MLHKAIRTLLNKTAFIVPTLNGKIAFNLLCYVPNYKINKPVKSFLGTSKKQKLKIKDHEAILHKWGTGPKRIFFLHGWRSSSYQWKPFIEQINLTEFSIYALDAPGHGMAKGKHLNLALYNAFLTKSFILTGNIHTLIGHSLGCLVIAYRNLKYGDIPSRNFIIMGSPSGIDAILTYFQAKLNLNQKAILNLSTRLEKVLEFPLAHISLKAFFKNVDRPTLVIHDENDKITPITPIREGASGKELIETFYTNTQDHMLKGQETVTAISNFVINK